MQHRRPGAAGPSVSELGPGCMGMSGMYGPSDRAESIATIHAAPDAGDLQIEHSLISRGIEGAIPPACRELGIGISAFGVLSRGLISGHWREGAGIPAP